MGCALSDALSLSEVGEAQTHFIAFAGFDKNLRRPSLFLMGNQIAQVVKCVYDGKVQCVVLLGG
jgi:hypothetical protein